MAVGYARAVLEDVMISAQQREAGLKRLRRTLKPDGFCVLVVGARELTVIEKADFLEEWCDCERQARSTPEAIEAFLDLVESVVSDDDDDTLLTLGPDQYAFFVESRDFDGGDPLAGPLPDLSTGEANALSRFDILR